MLEQLTIPQNLDPFVKEIVLIKSTRAKIQHKIPFYADGFAGIAFSKSEQPFVMQPQNKILPSFYLYGQTLTPMTLETYGNFEKYALRLFPFAVRTLIGVDPKSLNDDCYDLLNHKEISTAKYIDELNQANAIDEVQTVLIDFFDNLLLQAASDPDNRTILATNMILKSKGKIRMSEIHERLHVSERTLERQFKKDMGVTAIQFAKIIQFHSTIKIMSDDDYIKLSDIAYHSGYADQSHFIRSFRKYTGKTPKEFKSNIS